MSNQSLWTGYMLNSLKTQTWMISFSEDKLSVGRKYSLRTSLRWDDLQGAELGAGMRSSDTEL